MANRNVKRTGAARALFVVDRAALAQGPEPPTGRSGGLRGPASRTRAPEPARSHSLRRRPPRRSAGLPAAPAPLAGEAALRAGGARARPGARAGGAPRGLAAGRGAVQRRRWAGGGRRRGGRGGQRRCWWRGHSAGRPQPPALRAPSAAPRPSAARASGVSEGDPGKAAFFCPAVAVTGLCGQNVDA